VLLLLLLASWPWPGAALGGRTSLKNRSSCVTFTSCVGSLEQCVTIIVFGDFCRHSCNFGDLVRVIKFSCYSI
jgi:hypothetical protein